MKFLSAIQSLRLSIDINTPWKEKSTKKVQKLLNWKVKRMKKKARRLYFRRSFQISPYNHTIVIVRDEEKSSDLRSLYGKHLIQKSIYIYICVFNNGCILGYFFISNHIFILLYGSCATSHMDKYNIWIQVYSF